MGTDTRRLGRGRELAPSGTHRYAPLDGVRALAIATVLAFHTDGQWLSGGFLGVDIFFVLSGYLMVGILTDARAAGLSMRVSTFWLRRARRLAPALLIMVAAVMVVAALGRGGPEGLRGDVVAALLYMTNWWSLASGAEYFGQWLTPSPLLQTWSLAIEEQFYLVLPVLLWLMFRTGFRRRALAPAFLVLAGASALWAWHLQSADPLRVYFGTDTRIQALFLGGFLAMVSPRPRDVGDRESTPIRQVAGWTGLAGLLVLVAGVRPWTQSLPAWVLTTTALLSAVLIWGLLESPRSVLARCLSWPPLVWVGGVSYALYLWHWPVFLWVQGERDTALGAQLWAIALSVLLAWATTRFLERPVRSGRFAGWPAARQWLAYLVAVLTLIGLAAILPLHVPGTGPPDSDWPAARSLPSRIALFGDSTAYTVAAGFPLSRYGGIRYSSLTPLGCGLRDRRLQRGDLDAAKPECDGWQDRWRQRMDEFKPAATLLMEHVWEMYDVVRDDRTYPAGSPEYNAVVRAAVDEALDIVTPPQGGPVFIIGVPCHAALEPFYAPTLNDSRRQAALNAVLQEAAAERPQVHFIDMAGLTCGPDGPVQEIDGTQLRHDGVHWSESGRQYFWTYVLRQVAVLTDAESTPTSP